MPMCGDSSEYVDLAEVMSRLNIDVKDILVTPKPTGIFRRKDVDEDLRQFVFTVDKEEV